MKLTPEELDVFKNLAKTELGAFLVSYLKRVQDYAYDSRSWKEGDTKESAHHAARLLQELVIDKVRFQAKSVPILNQHE